MVNLTLERLKPLTNDQYEECRSKALERVAKRIGDKPARKTFYRELGPVATPLDWLALVVFIAALAISSMHIVQFMSKQAAASYHAVDVGYGILISPDLWAAGHQIGAILLAESAALLFMTVHAMGNKRANRKGLGRWVSVWLVLALIAAVFVFVANLDSGVNILVSVMPPIFTLGIAVRLESIIVEILRRRDEVNARYQQALTDYEAGSADPTKHSAYLPLLRQEIWSRLMTLRPNKDFQDAPKGFKIAAIMRETERETWTADDAIQPVTVFSVSTNGHGDDPRPLELPVHERVKPGEQN